MATTEIYGSPANRWVVYSLECEWTPVKRNGEAWKVAASNADKLVYVGSTNDIDRRLQEHIEGSESGWSDVKSSQFTQTFPPEELMSLQFVESEEEARRIEEITANNLRELYPGWFVYQA